MLSFIVCCLSADYIAKQIILLLVVNGSVYADSTMAYYMDHM